MSRSRQREVNVDGALPRNQARGSVGRRVHDDERIHPAAMRRRDQEVAAGRQAAPGRQVRMRNRKRPKRTNRATRRRSRYGHEALTSGGRPSHGEALDRAAAGGGQRLGRDAGGRWPAAAAVAGVGRARSAAGGAARARLGHGSCARASGRRGRRRFGPASPSAASAAARRVPPRRRRAGCVASSSSASTSVVRPRSPTARRRARPPGSSPRRPDRAPGRHRRATSAARRRPCRPMAVHAGSRWTGHEPERHELRGRDPEERPVVVAQRLEHEPDDAVPDEEGQQQVARGGAARASGSRSRSARGSR